MEHPSKYRDQEVVVLGMAKSGQAVAEVFQRFGAKVTINDRKSRAECDGADALEALGVRVICGEHPEDLIDHRVKLIVKNPGIPYTIAPIQAALENGVEVVTEVEVASFLHDRPTIAVTGSNGKTTTTTWIGEVLRASGHDPIVAGNIGVPLCQAVEQAGGDWLVAELSSFQLKGTETFRPNISCLLNVEPTHLDYHQTMEDYMSSKGRLFANQQKEDTAVINWDDPNCRKLAGGIRAKIMPFSIEERLTTGVCMSECKSYIELRPGDGSSDQVIAVSEIGLPGSFNVLNAMAVTGVCHAAGMKAADIAPVLRQFRGVEHRLEFVTEVRGVDVYNNSKATNTKATAAALDAIGKPVVLIAGGLDRGVEAEDVIPMFKEHVKGVVLIGQTRHTFAEAAKAAGVELIATIDQTEPEQAMEIAVQWAFDTAVEGDAILLSPACASWDMFQTFEERGSMFKQSVHKLVLG